jgi:hypothetical protein
MSSIILTSSKSGTIRFHLTTLLLVVPIFLAKDKFSVVAMLLGWTLIIVSQLLGQLYMARKRELVGIEFYITPLATITIYRPKPSVYEMAVVAWGLIGGQALLAGISLLLMVTLPLNMIGGEYKSCLDIFYITVFCNVLLLLLSLYPKHPLPGAVVWSVFSNQLLVDKSSATTKTPPSKNEDSATTKNGDYIH